MTPLTRAFCALIVAVAIASLLAVGVALAGPGSRGGALADGVPTCCNR